ncbi:synapse differentiation-inducing gene protein 1-like [Leptodactylus fuscus]
MYQSPQPYPTYVGDHYPGRIPLQEYSEPPPPYCYPSPVVEAPLPLPVDAIVVSPENNVVVVTTPTYKDYLGCSIFNLICCCFPIGLAALIFSCKTKNSTSCGDLTSAASNSRVAFILNMVALALGLAIYFSGIAYSSYMIATGQSFYIEF